MPQNFKLYSQYYNLLYADKDYAGESAFVVDRIRKFSPKAKSILELGSGTGSHGVEMIRKGFDVFGLERSESMVKEATSKGFPCQLGDVSEFQLGKKYDAVVSLFHVISYLTKNDELVSCFRSANKHLNDGGIFLFDAWYTPAVYTQKATPRLKRMNDSQVSVLRVAEPLIDVNNNVVDVRYTVLANDLKEKTWSEFQESHPMRHFSIPEIEMLASFTGFKFLKAEEFLTGNEPGENTWGVCFMLMKK